MFVKWQGDKRRVDDRLDVSWDAVATIDEEKHSCEVTNVSTAGAMMKVNIELQEKQEFLLTVQGLNEYAAEVVWANRPFYGVKLLVGEDMKLKEYADKFGLCHKRHH